MVSTDTKEFEKRLLRLAKLSDPYIAKIRKEYQQNVDYKWENSCGYEKAGNPFPFNPDEANLISVIEYHSNEGKPYYVFTTRLLDDMNDCLVIYYDLTNNSFDDDGETLNDFDLAGLNLAKHQNWLDVITPLPLKIKDKKLTLKSKLTMDHLIQFAEILSNLYALKDFLVYRDNLFEIKVRDDD